MVMVLIAERGYFAVLLLTVWLNSAVVTIHVAVMPEMCRVVRQVFQRNAYIRRRRVGGIQREQDGKNKGEASAHG